MIVVTLWPKHVFHYIRSDKCWHAAHYENVSYTAKIYIAPVKAVLRISVFI